MNDYGRDDELGELAASFNNMAENLQQTERQRREFITNISHELKTPMTTIAGYTDGILDGTIPPENERQYLQIISDESRRLSRLVAADAGREPAAGHRPCGRESTSTSARVCAGC